MLDLSALDLARIQFAFTISFHIIFPAITIGMAAYLVVLEGLWLYTRQTLYRDLYHFWVKIFALNFGMGVVSGLVMAYQFGTNWSFFSDFAGGVTGPLLTYEVLTAFFLEAGFLGVMLFGWNRVAPGLHFVSTVMVALGTLISMTWILASNSWMQTPTGFEIVDGRVVPVDWLAVIFSPSFPYRLVHMAIAAFLSNALFVGASAAWLLLRGRDNPAIRTMFSMALWMLLIVAPLQAVVGDFHGLNTLEHQPVKVAAMEGHWENHPGEGVPMVLFALPDQEAETNRFAVTIPHLASLILTHSWDGQIPSLKDFPAEDRPPVAVVLWSFRIMVGLGVLMSLLGFWGLWLRRGGKVYRSPNFLRAMLWMGPTGLVALLAGWVTTEVGRQPWAVYGLQRTAEGVSGHGVQPLTISLALFVLVYFAVFSVGIAYMLRLVARGPVMHEGDTAVSGGPGHERQQMRPISAATDDEADAAPTRS